MNSIVDYRLLTKINTHLIYNPSTGLFFWKRKHNGALPGKQAGNIYKKKSGKCYLHINIYTFTYGAHCLAWILMTGKIPDGNYVIDHIDGDGLNNKFDNLRCVTNQVNSKNIVLVDEFGAKYCKVYSYGRR